MSKLLNCTIEYPSVGSHIVQYRIFTSMIDVKNTDIQDSELNELLNIMGWDTDDYDFMYPIIRIYNILDEDGKLIDKSRIRYDIKTFCLSINNQFERINYPDHPIYFTSVQYMKAIVSGNNEQSKKYNEDLAHECIKFESAGFFNIKALVKSDKAISFVYGNKSAYQIYLELITKALI